MAETLLQQAFDESREKLISAICKLKKVKRLEYVESTGSQYVDTGIVPYPLNTEIEVSVSNLKTATSNLFYGLADFAFGIAGPEGGYASVDVLASKTNCHMRFGESNRDEVKAEINGLLQHTFKINGYKKEAYIDSTKYTLSSTNALPTWQSNNYRIMIFATCSTANGSAVNISKSGARVHFAKISKNDIPVRDFIPVKDQAGVAGLLDLVSGQIFYSATSTSLLAGPEATPYFSRIEYLESTGTQYIDTGMSVANTLGYVARAKFSGVNNWMCGARSGYNQNQFGLLYDSNGKFVSRYGNTEYQISGDENAHTFSHIGNVFSIDGVVKNTFTQQTFSASSPFYLFSISLDNSGTPATAGFVGRIYSCDVYSSSTLVRSFVPIRVEQTGYLFDLVSGQFFGNAGTGSFVLGPDVA